MLFSFTVYRRGHDMSQSSTDSRDSSACFSLWCWFKWNNLTREKKNLYVYLQTSQVDLVSFQVVFLLFHTVKGSRPTSLNQLFADSFALTKYSFHPLHTFWRHISCHAWKGDIYFAMLQMNFIMLQFKVIFQGVLMYSISPGSCSLLMCCMKETIKFVSWHVRIVFRLNFDSLESKSKQEIRIL